MSGKTIEHETGWLNKFRVAHRGLFFAIVNQNSFWVHLPVAVIAALLAVLALTFVLMLAAGQVRRVLGVTGVHVVMRVMGILLAALAVQFLCDGIAQSGLIG